ncbi:protein DpdF [Mycolicibacterium elephantis]|uniref:protein DpdF n=1 Tax=Mycolicibacterium elephantis TaxID=81858 RepID=UPI003A84652C
MSRLELELVQRALMGEAVDRSTLTGPFQRLVDAWQSRCEGPAIRSDVLSLLSQVLRHVLLTNRDYLPSLEVPLEMRGIATDDLPQFNLTAEHVFGGNQLIKPTGRWEPDWLQGDPRWIDHSVASPDCILYESAVPVSTNARGNGPSIPADPAVTAIAPLVQTYRSPAQATALRTVALAPPGSTLHIVLPTGSGKSIVGIVPGLVEPDATTVVIVPTIALAIDQERQAATMYPGAALPRELAFHSGRTLEEKRAMRERLVAGTQRILFTSPESFVQNLAPQLRELSERGGLTYVVIDEAHLVYAWGLDFRPEFQLAASLISELRTLARARNRSELKTVLMTATLSADALRLNDELFASSRRSIFIGSTHLRTELRYLACNSESEEMRRGRFIEAMRHLPKPAIVYTTTRHDAVGLVELLRTTGFSRTAFFHGNVGHDERERILAGWSGADGATSIDIVVGTTAFGLGIDQSDVRTVVHACIPRSVDRFYQEVGRGGRDGHTAVSVWLPNPMVDFQSSRVEISRLIGPEKGWNRWEALRLNRLDVAFSPSRSITIDLKTIPSHGDKDSEKNQRWNRNLITVLRHAGVIEVSPVHPPVVHREPHESDEEWEARLSFEWEKFRTNLDVRSTVALDEDRVTRAVEDVKKSVKERERLSFERIRRMLALDECWGQILAEEYSIDVPEVDGAELRPAPACSGCPAAGHQRDPHSPPAIPTNPAPIVPKLDWTLMPGLADEFMGHPTLVVTYNKESRRLLPQAIATAVNGGISQVLYSRSLADTMVRRIVDAMSTRKLIIVSATDVDRAGRKMTLPTSVIASETDHLSPWLISTTSAAAPRIVFAPAKTPAPNSPHMYLEDVIQPSMNIETFVRRL